MTESKKRIAQAVKAALDEFKLGNTLSCEYIFSCFEYPPDEKLGDLALPCFKFSRELKAAPPAIAARLAETIKDECIEKNRRRGRLPQHSP